MSANYGNPLDKRWSHYQDSYFYSLPLLRELVEHVVNGTRPAPDPEARSNGDPAEGNNIGAMLADVQVGVYRLMDSSHRATLIAHYQGWYEPSEAALEAGLVDLQRVLGGPRP